MVNWCTRSNNRKRRDHENRIGEILSARTECYVTGALLRKIANARDQLLIFLNAPNLGLPRPRDEGASLREDARPDHLPQRLAATSVAPSRAVSRLDT
jgi:hypothetical protein